MSRRKAKPAAQRPSLHQRIVDATRGEPRVGYWTLMHRVWPEDKYPNAYRRSSNGGPPGVAMVFGSALRKLGVHIHRDQHDRPVWFDRNRVEAMGLTWPRRQPRIDAYLESING